MRRLVLLAGLFPALAFAQSPFGNRLGDEISPEEKQYFGLFPNVEAFRSVRVDMVGDSARLVVARSAQKDTTLALRPGQLAALRAFVESFEQSQSAFLNPNWQLAAGTQDARLLDPGTTVPYVDGTRSQVAVRRGDRVFSGIVLKADEDRLLLHPVAPYDWRAPRAVAIPASEIGWVDLEPAGAERLTRAVPLIGGGLGLAVAGADVFLLDGGVRSVPLFALAAGAGIVFADQFLPSPPPRASYAERLRSLSDRAAFRQLAPVDFPGATVEADVLASRRANAPGALGTFARWRQSYGWIHVAAVGGASSRASATGSIEELVRVGGSTVDATPAVLSGTATPLAGIDVGLRPVPWVRLGATWMRYEDDRPSLERASAETLTPPEGAYVAPGTVRGYAELVLPSPRRGGVGLEAAFGGGLTTTTGTVERNSTVSNTDLSYRFESASRTPFLQATVELVMPRRTSFFLRWTSARAPEAILVPGAEQRSAQFPDLIAYQRDPHTVTFEGYQDIVWGTRLRL